MKQLKFFICWILTFTCGYCYSQNKIANKKDTLFYLLDTAKIPYRDRMIVIIPYPKSASFFTYILNTRCWIQNTDPVLMSAYKEKGELMTKKEIRGINFISLVELNDLLCKEQQKFKSKHQLYFIEYLPNGKYLKRKILLGDEQIAIE